MANSSILVLPNVIMPASFKRETTVASYGAIKLSSIFEPQVVFVPLVQKISLWARGIPVRGPALPSCIRLSADLACPMAFSGIKLI